MSKKTYDENGYQCEPIPCKQYENKGRNDKDAWWYEGDKGISICVATERGVKQMFIPKKRIQEYADVGRNRYGMYKWR